MEKLYKLAIKAEKRLEEKLNIFDRETEKHKAAPTCFTEIDVRIAQERVWEAADYHSGVLDATQALGLTDKFYQYRRNNK